MLKGIHAGDTGFMVNLDRIEARISSNNSQITSGVRVEQAQDDPFAIQSILSYQDQLQQLNQLQKNMNVSKTDAENADAALSTASDILNKLLTTASQGLSAATNDPSSNGANTNKVLAISARQLTQQLVNIANTQTGTRFVFGGDAPLAQPVTFDSTTTPPTLTVSSVPSTGLLMDANGSTLPAGQTAKQIFGDSTGGIFASGLALATALDNNDTAGIKQALSDLHAGNNHLSAVTASYGNIEGFINTTLSQIDSKTVSLTTTISSLRDTDVPAAITQMTADQTSLTAALSAHASLSQKTLFDYLG